MTGRQRHNERRIRRAAIGFRFFHRLFGMWEEIGCLQYISGRQQMKHLARHGKPTKCKLARVRIGEINATE